jgi:hypothetical protein
MWWKVHTHSQCQLEIKFSGRFGFDSQRSTIIIIIIIIRTLPSNFKLIHCILDLDSRVFEIRGKIKGQVDRLGFPLLCEFCAF